MTDTVPSSGEYHWSQKGSGRIVMQAAADFLVGALNPGLANMAVALPPASADQESNRRPKGPRLGALPFDRGWM